MSPTEAKQQQVVERLMARFAELNVDFEVTPFKEDLFLDFNAERAAAWVVNSSAGCSGKIYHAHPSLLELMVHRQHLVVNGFCEQKLQQWAIEMANKVKRCSEDVQNNVADPDVQRFMERDDKETLAYLEGCLKPSQESTSRSCCFSEGSLLFGPVFANVQTMDSTLHHPHESPADIVNTLEEARRKSSQDYLGSLICHIEKVTNCQLTALQGQVKREAIVHIKSREQAQWSQLAACVQKLRGLYQQMIEDDRQLLRLLYLKVNDLLQSPACPQDFTNIQFASQEKEASIREQFIELRDSYNATVRLANDAKGSRFITQVDVDIQWRQLRIFADSHPEFNDEIPERVQLPEEKAYPKPENRYRFAIVYTGQ